MAAFHLYVFFSSPKPQLPLEAGAPTATTPPDNLQQPVDLDSAAHFNEFMVQLTENIATDPERPAWSPTSFFRRYAVATK